MRNAVSATFTFTREGNGASVLRESWGPPGETFTWAEDNYGTLELPPIDADAAFVELSAYPYLYGDCRTQPVITTVNGQVVGTANIRWLPTPCAVPVPTRTRLSIRLDMPRAARPPHGHRLIGIGLARLRVITAEATPHRPLRIMPGSVATPYEMPAERAGAIAVQLLGVDAPAVVTSFESLGVNCEFGLFQRSVGAEPLGLLRLAGIFPTPLLEALDSGFEGAGDSISMKPDGDHWHATDARYGFVYHTPIPVSEPTDQAVAKDRTRLRYLRRLFCDDMRAGEKIYVRHSNGPMTAADALPIFLALNRHGANTLLFVAPAGGHPPGTVEEIMPGLLRGHIDRLGDEDTRWWISSGSWLEVCANALKLWGER